MNPPQGSVGSFYLSDQDLRSNLCHATKPLKLTNFISNITVVRSLLTLLVNVNSAVGGQMAKDVLGELEHHVLLALMRLGSDGYSVTIVDELEERTGREIAPAAVYITLKRLEKKGLVRSKLRTAGRQKGGHERRYYSVTAAGKVRILEARRAYMNLWEGMDPSLESGT